MSSLRSKAERLAYRNYRRIKSFYLKHPGAPFGRTFFRLSKGAHKKLSAPKVDRFGQLEAALWKMLYLTKYGDSRPFQLITQSPVAAYSDDTKWPRGAIYDNSTNRDFNLKVYHHFRHKPGLSLLDLGCAGGGLVKSFLADGYTAVGLEGSDAPKCLRSGEWDTIPYHLFSCDITEPFEIRDAGGNPAKFDVITAWEVLEHIPEAKLPGLISNIRKHLNDGGIFIASVALFPDGDPSRGLVYHVTLKPKSWWLERWAEHGIAEVTHHPFEVQDYVRGRGQGIKNWDPRDGDGFHLVLGLTTAN
jgi:SAM-dependent methyltransferase